MTSRWGYQLPHLLFVVSWPVQSGRARGPPWARRGGREHDTGPNRRQGQRWAASPGEPRIQPETIYGQESRYDYLPYIYPRVAQEASGR
jgi:hypothetical protein